MPQNSHATDETQKQRKKAARQRQRHRRQERKRAIRDAFSSTRRGDSANEQHSASPEAPQDLEKPSPEPPKTVDDEKPAAAALSTAGEPHSAALDAPISLQSPQEVESARNDTPAEETSAISSTSPLDHVTKPPPAPLETPRQRGKPSIWGDIDTPSSACRKIPSHSSAFRRLASAAECTSARFGGHVSEWKATIGNFGLLQERTLLDGEKMDWEPYLVFVNEDVGTEELKRAPEAYDDSESSEIV